jgi:hypothetical protein
LSAGPSAAGLEVCVRQRWTAAMIVTAVAIGATASAQSRAPAPVSQRPFSGLFGDVLAPRPILRFEARPVSPEPKSPVKCEILVMPADPRLDRRMSIAPPASTRFSMRQVPRLACR